MKKQKRTTGIIVVLFLFVAFLLTASPSYAKVKDEECQEKYELCILGHGGWIPGIAGEFGRAYCTIGLTFCLVFMA